MLSGLGEYCAEVLAEHDCPSVSVAVAERGEVVLAEAYGLADVGAERAATPGTAYLLASITKPMTATAVCVAADEGLLDLDAPVSGEFGWPAPTLRQLLLHRGGFGAHYDFQYGGFDARTIDADRYAVLYRAPGSGFEYANLGYRALGQALEAASGQELGEFVRERVFEPLGLKGCRLGSRYTGPRASAVPYTIDGRAYPERRTSHPGATLGWADAGELALFAQSYERLLKPGTALAVRDAVPINRRLGYGLGWCVSYGGDGPVVQSHGGRMGGVAVMVATVPERHLSVAVLTNSTGSTARDAVVRYVLGALVPGFTEGLISPVLDDPERPVELPEGAWAGRISTPEGDVPVELRLLADRRAELRLAGGTATGRAVASEAWDLRLALPLQLPTADARVASPLLTLGLRLGDGRLTGVACAYQDGDREGWLGNFLSHRCELRPVP
jgi:CubicO group peptidase (beta-lactamase class C family)